MKLDGPLDGKEPLGGDAHDQVGLGAQQDRLGRMPEVGEELDVELVVQVKVGMEAVDDNHDNEEEVDDGEGDDGLVEVGVDACASEHNAGEEVAKKANSSNRSDAYLGWIKRRILCSNCGFVDESFFLFLSSSSIPLLSQKERYFCPKNHNLQYLNLNLRIKRK